MVQRFLNYYGRDSQPVRNTLRPGSNPLTNLTTNQVVDYAQSFMNSINTTFPIFTEPSMDTLLQDWEYNLAARNAERDPNVGSLLVVLILAASSSVSLIHLAPN